MLNFSDGKREIPVYMPKKMIACDYHVVLLMNKQFTYMNKNKALNRLRHFPCTGIIGVFQKPY